MTAAADDGWPDFTGPLTAYYYRDQLVAHADDLVTQVCTICQVHQCPAWHAARDRLRVLDELTTAVPRDPAAADLDRQPRR